MITNVGLLTVISDPIPLAIPAVILVLPAPISPYRSTTSELSKFNPIL